VESSALIKLSYQIPTSLRSLNRAMQTNTMQLGKLHLLPTTSPLTWLMLSSTNLLASTLPMPGTWLMPLSLIGPETKLSCFFVVVIKIQFQFLLSMWL